MATISKVLGASAGQGGRPLSMVAESTERVVHAVRDHLGMDIAFVSEFVGEDRLLLYVDSEKNKGALRQGDRIPLREGYCQHIVEGRLPELIKDTAGIPLAAEMPETRAMPIGAHIGVPLRFSDGRLFGTFCCLSFDPDPSLNERDLKMMRSFADLISFQLDNDTERVRLREISRARVGAAIDAGEPAMVFQPIIRLSDDRTACAEALSRFSGEPSRGPDAWFREAREAGLSTQLETRAIANAIHDFRRIWARSELALMVNVSPQTICQGDLQQLLVDLPGDIVFEITEHEHVEDYDALRQAIAPLRARGARIAVDDAGAGYASMAHILNLRPDYIKLDVSLTRSINDDPVKRALAAALISFADEIGSTVVAEGVETSGELDSLRRLGVHLAQGYFLGRPQPVDRFARAIKPKMDASVFRQS